MTNGYTKLFSTLVGSTLWRDGTKEMKIVWITMLAMANRDGIVECSVPGLADFAKVTRSECEDALERLKSPDPDSRTPDFEGRRIERVTGGWKILNYVKYREKMNLEERRLYLAQKQKEFRHRKKELEKGESIRQTIRRNLGAEESLKNISLHEPSPAYTTS